MKVFVTGGAGYIGSHVVRQLLEAGHKVAAYDNLSEGHARAIPAEILVRGDLADETRLIHALTAYEFDCVIHFAAFTSASESVRDPEKYYFNNSINGLRLLAAIREAGVERVLFSSSAAVYGVPQKLPIPEEHLTRPVNVYGQTKLDFENTLASYARAYGLGYIALRYFNAAGAHAAGDIGEDHRDETHLIPLVLEAALGKGPGITIFGTDYPTPDGTCVRDYIHVEDLARAHILALDRIEPGKGKAYNLGNAAGYSVREVIETARKVTGKEIPAEEGPRRPGDVPQLVASSNRFIADTRWTPECPHLEGMIETAWRWHSTHPDGYGD
ncbi:MAG: UDP-glucose 4-epimerase GalE [Phycisphaerae bacterium]|jgi:UDP-glucose-4-epimerase GalE|nr:UDP-glucose 4-epimerase GalE [Phycisphaerae bacterium]